MVHVQTSMFAKEVAKFEHFAYFFCSVVLFDVFHHDYHVWMDIVPQI